MVHGSRNDAETLRDEVSAVLAPMGLRLSEDKTSVCHIDKGFDFLGWRIQRRTWRSRANHKAVHTSTRRRSHSLQSWARSDGSHVANIIERSQACYAD